MRRLGMPKVLKAPFPYYGGKSVVAPLVWQFFGDVRNYVEPFFGSGAVLLARPQPFVGTETVNDVDGLLCNFWRALQADPEGVAHHADWPVAELDLHARHLRLVEEKAGLTERLIADPDYFDGKLAGWWCWGLCCWIGSGWCSGAGPWQVEEVDGERRLVQHPGTGQGVNRPRPHLWHAGQGVNRQLPHLGPEGNGMHWKRGEQLHEYFRALADRLRRVRICSGDWSRVCGPTPTVKQGLTAVFLDPPYGLADDRDPRCYGDNDDLSVASRVRDWALSHGDDSRLRICLCGYDSFTMPEGWTRVRWKTQGGYGNHANQRGRANSSRECLYFSPHCLGVGYGPLFDGGRDRQDLVVELPEEEDGDGQEEEGGSAGVSTDLGAHHGA
jgi:hypothetical protein